MGLIEHKILYRVKDPIAQTEGLSSHGMGGHVGWGGWVGFKFLRNGLACGMGGWVGGWVCVRAEWVGPSPPSICTYPM